MALQLTHISPTNPLEQFPNAYARCERIQIEQTERRAVATFYIFESAEAAALYAKQRRQANYGDAFPEGDPRLKLPQVGILGQASARIEGADFDAFALAQIQMQNNVLSMAYDAARAQVFEEAINV